MSEEGVYRARETESGWEVADEDDRTVAVCGAEPNARHYEALLNAAWRRGYKAGYRAAKQA